MSDYQTKIIDPVLPKTIIDEDDDTLALVAVCTGKRVVKGTAPFIGKYVRIGNELISEKNPKIEHLEFGYLWNEDEGSLQRVIVGSPVHGPLMMWTDNKWLNLYGHGNHGNNACTGGGWSCDCRRPYSTMLAALNDRDFKVGRERMLTAALCEGPLLRAALQAAAAIEH